MENNPKVSIIMPVYNAARYVGETIRSVLAQTFHDFELIIIDDGSTDGSEKVCRRLAEEDSRIRLYRQENHGICYSRNAAIVMARGEYIAFCDHDDLYEPEYLECLIDIAKKNNADFIKGQYKGIIENHGYKVTNTTMDYLDGTCSLERLLKDYRYFLRTINVLWNGLYVRRIIKENGIRFDESFKAGWEDNLFNLEYMVKSKKICGVNKLIYTHIRRTGQSASLGYNAHRTEDLLIVYQKEAVFLEKNKEIISGKTFIDHQNRFLSALKTELWYADCPLTVDEKRNRINEFIHNRNDFKKVSFRDFILALKNEPKVTIKWLMFHLKLSWLLCFYWDLSSKTELKTKA